MEGTTFYFEWEPVLMEWLQGGMGSALTFVMSFITLFGEEAVAVGVLVFLYWVWDKEAAVFAGTNVLAGTVLNPVLKNFVLRRRPYFDHPSITCFKPVHEGDIYDIAVDAEGARLKLEVVPRVLSIDQVPCKRVSIEFLALPNLKDQSFVLVWIG